MMSLAGLEIDHIGIAVESIDEAANFYQALGFMDLHKEEITSEKVKVGMFALDNKANIELLESTDPEGPIAKFIAKKGPGIHHICLRVADIKAKIAELKAKGIKLINDEPKKGAHNCLIAFIHPKSTGGVLIELSQAMD